MIVFILRKRQSIINSNLSEKGMGTCYAVVLIRVAKWLPSSGCVPNIAESEFSKYSNAEI